ncbi:hypothetical protein AEYBE204_12190 [Asticcacaulis sp. YBE204]|nr:hypothetical protein AEYBE204_12190 [Asticcacaulis sp. YBE204]
MVAAEQKARLSGARLAALFDQSPNFMTWLTGPNHVFEYANPAYMTLIGNRDILGKPVAEALPETVGQGFIGLLDEVLRTGQPYKALGTRIDLSRAQGLPAETRVLDFVYQPIKEAEGQITGIFVEGSDVTDRYNAEAALRHSEEQLRLATEGADIGLWDIDLVAGRRYWTPRVKAMFGLSADAEVGMGDFYPRLHPLDLDATKAAFEAALNPDIRAPYDVEYRAIGASDNQVRWVAAKGKAIFDTNGRAVRVVGTAIDITEKKNADCRRDALIDLTDAIRQIETPDEVEYTAAKIIGETLGASRVGFGSVDSQVTTLTIARDWVSTGVRSLEGTLYFAGYDSFIACLKAGEIVHIHDVYADDRSRAVAERWSEAGARSLVNVPVIERGHLVALLFVNHDHVRHWSEDEVDFIQEVAARTRTATERIRSDNALRELNANLERRVEAALEEKALLADIVETTDAMIQVVDLDYNWLGVNRSSANEFEKVVGIRPRIGANMLEALKNRPQLLEGGRALWARAFAGERFTSVVEFPHPEYGCRFYEMNLTPLKDKAGSIIGAYQFVYDVTDRLEEQQRLADAEAHLRQAQKMEAVGQLTGGIAHDFNNMLAVVMGSLELLNRRVVDDPRARHFVKSALDSAKRAATLTQRLLAFSRQQPLQPETVNVNRLVSGMSELLSHALGGAVRVETVHGAGLWSVNVDPNQLENVILNLAVNARDAMPDGGKVTIETQNAHIDERYVVSEPGVEPGQYVMIAVSDTGTGMPPEIMAKAFDPFFTTKPVGKGTGLGLSQVYGFVKQSGGHVRIYSEAGQGTTIKIYLPRHHADDVALSAKEDSQALLRGDLKELILVVDDEDAVRQFSVDAITELGYRVISASNAADALAYIEAEPEISLLFTDIVMPEVNGRKLADQARVIRPDLKVLYTTGYTRNAVVHNGVLDPGVELIGKPFSLDELAAKIRSMLDDI